MTDGPNGPYDPADIDSVNTEEAQPVEDAKPDIAPQDDAPEEGVEGFNAALGIIPQTPLLFKLGDPAFRADRILKIEPQGTRSQHSRIFLESANSVKVGEVVEPVSVLVEHVKVEGVLNALNSFAQGVRETSESEARRESLTAGVRPTKASVPRGKRPR